ncbi:helix-turn-helix transcriptional regulator [Saccharopolyspora spinosa]|nr:helix-turn-helix transcriptional regulator [Saccharopolyspora spinosa]
MLRSVRVQRQLRQVDVARLARCHEVTIQRLEAGTRAPSVVLANRVADALDLNGPQRALLLSVAVAHAGHSSPYRTGKIPPGTSVEDTRNVRDHYGRNTGTGETRPCAW